MFSKSYIVDKRRPTCGPSRDARSPQRSAGCTAGYWLRDNDERIAVERKSNMKTHFKKKYEGVF